MIALEGLWPFVSALPCRALDIAITSEVRSEIWLTFVAELPSAEWPVLGLLLPICSAEIQRPGHIRPFAADRGLVPPALIALLSIPVSLEVLLNTKLHAEHNLHPTMVQTNRARPSCRPQA